jgi:alkaline phosphatase D
VRLDRRDTLKLLGAGAPVLAAAAPAQGRAATAAFQHGVASGDPLQDRLIIWTRVTVGREAARGATSLRWVVAEDEGLDRVVAHGETLTGPERDWTAKVDVGGLKPGRDYFYAFYAGSLRSPVGRARTLPAGHVEEVTLAFVTCALYPNGYFNAYDHIARSEKLDAVVELGDYIYEYGGQPGDYGMANGEKLGRLPEPAHDIVSLADYRTRYAQYRRDPDLQAAHARAPWICVWDDHEVCNDTWRGGAENHHDKTEGPFEDRKANALQAYFEWMPIREPAPGRAREAIYRNFDWGDLLSLTMLESRLLARSYQLEYERAGDVPFVLYDSTDPLHRKRVTDPATLAAVMARTPEGGDPPKPYSFGPDVEAVRAYISDPQRQMLGPEQEAWLQRTLQASVKSGRPWQVIGNQVIMGRCRAPNLLALAGPSVIEEMLAQLPEPRRKAAARFIDIASYDLPFDLDGWDGYPAARARMDAIFASAGGGNAIVVSGDSHAFWVNQLHDAAGRKRLAAEFGVSAVTSPSIGDEGGGFQLGEVFMHQDPEVSFCDQLAKGYVRLTLRPDVAVGELVQVPIDAKPYQAKVLGTWRLKPTQGVGIAPLEKA